ncbi:MAG: deoxyribodipyrimidine photo-lyase [Thermomicrobium sp.]|nr:DNA photolyase family protein [Thermomicrobium sp.]MDW8059732.1 deoxyribodipyrimidine photo-lyase [Thermomicrobium sp.]
MTTTVWWIRRDLRLADNCALATALEGATRLVPLFVVDPHLTGHSARSQRRIAFLFSALRALDEALRERGSRLVVRSGDPVEVLPRVVAECGATLVAAEADFTPYARRRDERLRSLVPLRLTPGLTLRMPGTVATRDGRPPRIFRHFARAFLAAGEASRDDLLPPPRRLPPLPPLASEPLPDPPASLPEHWTPSETVARARLARFLGDAIARYHEARHFLDGQGTSRLSPYFRFGLLSVREAWHRAAELLDDPERGPGARAWLDELLWREFFHHLLAAFPESVTRSLRPAFRDVDWPGEPWALAAWREGNTGFPVVDAAMRQLAHEGWISNRARMVVANFLTRSLLVDWRAGERWFRKHLIDADLAANVGGWQWCAGTGTDAAPYFRIFDPVRQAERFDPTGEWIRQWVPELAAVPQPYLSAPWTMPLSLQLSTGCRVGRDYPAPIVDLSAARERALAWFRPVTRRKG